MPATSPTFRLALEARGPDTGRGRGFADRWRYPGSRHAFRVTTVVWGLAFLIEAVAQLTIIQSSSAGTAKASSNSLLLVVAALVIAWNVSSAKPSQRTGELAAARAGAGGDTPPSTPT